MCVHARWCVIGIDAIAMEESGFRFLIISDFPCAVTIIYTRPDICAGLANDKSKRPVYLGSI